MIHSKTVNRTPFSLHKFFHLFTKTFDHNSELTTLKQIINLLPGHVYWYDKNGIFHGCNDQQAKAFGFSKSEELIGKNGYEIQESQIALEELKKINELIYKTGQIHTVEEHGTYYGGQEITFLSKKLPWRNEKGEIIGIIGISFDITERKKYERELMIHAQILNALPGHVYWKDMEGRYLGSNLQQLQSVGFSKNEDLLGKTDYDIAPKNIAAFIRKIDKEVIKTGKTITREEPYPFLGKNCIMLSKKAPLKDEKGEVIGVLGSSFDITEEKKLKEELLKAKAQTEKTLQHIINSLASHIYWKDVNGVYLGCNDAQAISLGFEKGADIIGKTDFDLPWKKDAQKLRENDLYVMQQKKTVSFEEEGVFGGKRRVALSQKTPLEDEDGHVYGVLGVSIDITDRKEKERLEVENEAHKTQLEEQAKFKKIADQVAHDIRSPLAALLMIVKSCSEIPEEDRVSLRETAMSIQDIADSLLSRYRKEAAKAAGTGTENASPSETKSIRDESETQERQPTLISALLLQLLTDKKYQYQERTIGFDHEFTQSGNFAFIKIAPTALKRSISNLINNAVDAFDSSSKKENKVLLKLDATKEWVKISIQDNGKGMPAAVKEKILNNLAVTSGKKEGHGIGLTQVREMLQANQGELSIDSQEGKGTTITLTFPRIKIPSWMGDEITLGAQDIIVILDDDKSIHKAWDMHFEGILKKNPGIKLHHFQQGKEALSFINSLNPEDKSKVFLLSDYELLKQDLNGLHVIEQSKIARSLLVTSHYANEAVKSHASKTGTKILPKQLASEIPIRIDSAFKYQESSSEGEGIKKVDLVMIDDDKMLTEALICGFCAEKTVDTYQDPEFFLKNLSKYPKDTPICMDCQIPRMSGLELAKHLHDQGYTHLYMLTGEATMEKNHPDYLTVIMKDDMEGMQKFLEGNNRL